MLFTVLTDGSMWYKLQELVSAVFLVVTPYNGKAHISMTNTATKLQYFHRHRCFNMNGTKQRYFSNNAAGATVVLNVVCSARN